MPSTKEWQAKHKRARERKPLIRIDRVHVETHGDKEGYPVLIEGFNLHPAIAPPTVSVGGVPVERLQFQKDGRALRGLLKRVPPEISVVVDYGFARADLKAK